MPTWGIAITWQLLFHLRKWPTVTLDYSYLRDFCTTSFSSVSLEDWIGPGFDFAYYFQTPCWCLLKYSLKCKVPVPESNKAQQVIRPTAQISEAEVELRTQSSRPRTQKRSGAKDRNARDQGHKCKCFPKKKGLKKFFRSISKKNGLEKHFSADLKNLTIQKIVLSSSRGQGNFRGFEASRPRLRPRTWKCVLEAKDVLEDSTSAPKLTGLFSFFLF